ncbi:MAG: hypothetical protein AAF797_06560 [Planctomycetota bacterium]
MLVYAGIDEAGYGPFYGPLTVARSIFTIPNLPSPTRENPTLELPNLWSRLSAAVCQKPKDAKHRIPVADSKTLKTKAAGITHIERTAYSFLNLKSDIPQTAKAFVDAVETQASLGLPWYAALAETSTPTTRTPGEHALDAGLLRRTMQRIGVQCPDIRVATIDEQRLNALIDQYHSKAAASFTAVAQHIHAVLEQFGEHHPVIALDRQSGRTRYREPLHLAFPDAHIDILEETPKRSAYHLDADLGSATLLVQTEAESAHLPVALASIFAKLTREYAMLAFNHYFTTRIPDLKPTAGYGSDANRFRDDLAPYLAALNLAAADLRRKA